MGYSPVAARRHRDGGAVDVPSEVSAEVRCETKSTLLYVFDEHRGGAAASRAVLGLSKQYSTFEGTKVQVHQTYTYVRRYVYT